MRSPMSRVQSSSRASSPRRGSRPAFLAAAVAALLAGAPRAQGQPSPEEIASIARRVAEQMQEIDRMLLESGKKDAQRSRPKELLQQATERSKDVELGIDELIQKLQQMKDRQNSQSSSESQDQQQQNQQEQQDQQQQQQQQRGNQQQQNRRENRTPDFVQQEQRQRQENQQQGQEPQPGQQQPARPDRGNQQQDRPPQPGGRNTSGNNPPDSESEAGLRGAGDGEWGELQPYVNFLKTRGSPPKVPEKFRKYWEAYLRSKQEKK